MSDDGIVHGCQACRFGIETAKPWVHGFDCSKYAPHPDSRAAAVAEVDRLRADLAKVTADRDSWRRAETACDQQYTKLSLQADRYRSVLREIASCRHAGGGCAENNVRCRSGSIACSFAGMARAALALDSGSKS